MTAHVTEPRGTAKRPMTDAELDAKFIDQSNFVLPPQRTEELLGACYRTASMKNVGSEISRLL